MENTTGRSLYDLLVTRDFEPEILDSSGKAVSNPDDAELFSFDWKTENQNYGAVVILLGTDNELEVYFGDNLGRTMESDDKSDWYDFLHQMKQFATRNLLTFEINNINRLKYTMQGMAAIKEGLFEGYYGTRKMSYSDQPKQTKLVIKHNKTLDENDARYRFIESLFIETDQGERFKVPSRNLMHGKLLARHVAEGGTPYDAFGQHITATMEELHTLSRFVRAAKHRNYQGETAEMVEAAVRHYSDIKAKAKRMIGQRGYREERELFDPAASTESELATESIRSMFIEQNIDARIEEALPILARLQAPMKEAQMFETWADSITEGTWALPDTLDAQKKLQQLMSQELIVGPDATNATEQLYDLVGDDKLFDALEALADQNPDANAWDDPHVMTRLKELGIENTDNVDENFAHGGLQGAPTGGTYMMRLGEEAGEFEPVKLDKIPQENNEIYDVRHLSSSLLPNFVDDSEPEDYSSSYYYRDPITDQVFVAYTHGGQGRVRGTKGMPDERMKEIAQMLGGKVEEDLDTDGVMMTKPSNMSSESIDRIKKLALT
jgi:hypothetical protein